MLRHRESVPRTRNRGGPGGPACTIRCGCWLGSGSSANSVTRTPVRQRGSRCPPSSTCIDEWRTADGEAWQPYGATSAPLERLVGGARAEARRRGSASKAACGCRRLLAAAGTGADTAAFADRCPFPATTAGRRGGRRDPRRTPRRRRARGVYGAAGGHRTRDAELAALRAAGPIASTAAATRRPRRGMAALVARPRACGHPRRPGLLGRASLRARLRAARRRGLPAARTARSRVSPAAAWTGRRWTRSPRGRRGRRGGADPVDAEAAFPAPARFGGMPAARFWEMEDARFDPGSVDAAPIDLGRLMLVGLRHGVRQRLVRRAHPHAGGQRQPGGELRRPRRLRPDQHRSPRSGRTRTDGTCSGSPQPSGRWCPIRSGRPAHGSSWPRRCPRRWRAPPTDVVMLFRDEMANVAWAVEALVRDDQGRPQDRFAQWAGARRPAADRFRLPGLPRRERGARALVSAGARAIGGHGVGTAPAGAADPVGRRSCR